VTSIGDYAFADCQSLTAVFCRVPQSAFSGNSAFSGTGGLTIIARASDTSWTAGTGISFQGNNDIEVIKSL
jgi:hypothetical protein